MRRLIILIAVLMLLPACGRRGDLVIPGTVLPEAPSGLMVDPRGDAVILGWGVPAKDTSGGPLTGLAGFTVMRAALPEDTGECPCQFERAGFVDMETPGKDAVVSGGRVVYSDSGPGLVPGGRYAYKVVPFNADGFSGPESNTVKVRLLGLPAEPGGLMAAPGNRGVTLTWHAPAADVSGGPVDDIAGYNVYRSMDKDAPPARPVNPAPVAGDSYEDAGLVNGTAYYYRVSALRGAEPPYTEGDPAGPVSATPADTVPPSVPTGLRAVPGEGRVLMSWDPDTEADLAGYIVYRKGPGDSEPKEAGRTGPGWITWEDAGVASGGEYTYSVSAFDDAAPANESGRSEVYSVKVP